MQGIIPHITTLEMASVLHLFELVMKVFLPRQNRWFAWY